MSYRVTATSKGEVVYSFSFCTLTVASAEYSRLKAQGYFVTVTQITNGGKHNENR